MNNAKHTTMATSPNRRDFLKTTSTAVAGTLFLGASTRAGYTAEDNTIRIALVGCGGRGTGAAANALATKAGPTKLVAMADVFEDKLSRSHEALTRAATRNQGSADTWVMGFQSSQVDVPRERQFLGFDAYKEAMDCLKPGDVVILTTPVAFRWVHFQYAIVKGLNVFMEKPVTVDGPTTRRMIQLGADAEKKNLKVGVGLMCRHCDARKALLSRIQDGQIGEITTLRSYRLVGPVGSTSKRPPHLTEVQFQVQRYLGFMWASGGVFHDFVAHNLDECCWMKGSWPVRADGMGSRAYRGDAVDQNFDHYSVEYTFADGTKLFLNSRYMSRCREEFASYAHGTKGSAVISTFMHTPAKCRIFEGHTITRADMTWAFPQPEPNPYQLEWDHLMDAIRKNQPYNEVKRGAESSLVVAMGRKAVHTGQSITFEDMLNDVREFAPNVDKMTTESPAPVLPGTDGLYPVPQPGRLQLDEYEMKS